MANLLIADSNEAMRQTTAEILRNFGHHIFFSEESSNLAETIQSQKIEVLLIDMELPGKEITEVIQEIKKQKPNLSIVVMIGIGEDSQKLISAGAFATISKPFNVQEMRRIIQEGIQQAKNAPVIVEEKAEIKKKKIKINKKIALGTVSFFCASVLGFAVFYLLSKKPPIKIFPISYANISGITTTSQSLWGCDWLNQSIVEHALDESLSEKKKISKEDWNPVLLAWDGENLWSYSSWEKKLAKHKMDDQLSIEEKIPVPDYDFSAFCSDGKSFFGFDEKSSDIVNFTVSNSTVSILKTKNSSVKKSIGMSKSGKSLWIYDSENRKLAKYDSEKDLQIMGSYELPDQFRNEKISCFCADDKDFWIGIETRKNIIKLNYKNLKKIKL